MRILLFILALFAMPGWAEELGADGFPVGWGAEDFHIAGEVSKTKQEVKGPTSFKVEELGKVSLTPSGSVPVALPAPNGKVSNSYYISGTSYKPLAAVFGGVSGSLLAPAGVVVGGETLGKSANDVKTLTEFGSLSWKGTTLWSQAAPMAARSPLVAVKIASPALKEAWRRVLLAKNPPPEDYVGQHWLAVRAEALEQIGAYEAAWSLWREVGPGARAVAPELAEGWAKSALLAGHYPDACALARAQVAEGKSEDWVKMVAVCTAVEVVTGGATSANAAALSLSLQLMPPEVVATDPLMVKSLEAVRDGATVEVPADASGLAAAVMVGFPAIISGSTAGLPDMALRRLRDTSALPLAMRVEAGRGLARSTNWLPDGVALTQLVSGGVPAPTTPEIAVLAWAAQTAALRGQKVSDTEEAEVVVKAALRLGEDETASAWLPKWLVKEGDTVQLKDKLQAEVAVQALSGKVSESTMQRWLVGQNVGTVEGSSNAQRVMLAVEGLGLAVSDSLWSGYRSRAVPVGDGDVAWRRLMSGAVRARDVPKILTLVSEGLAGQTADQASPAVVGDSIAALRVSGFEELAKRLAGEAMVGEKSQISESVRPQKEEVRKGQKEAERKEKVAQISSTLPHKLLPIMKTVPPKKPDVPVVKK